MHSRLALIAFAAVLGSACTMTPTFEGLSHADDQLRSDVLQTLDTLTRAQGCSSIERVNTSILSEPSGEVGHRSVTERWEAHGCQKTYDYQVVFTEDGHGGTFMNVRAEF